MMSLAAANYPPSYATSVAARTLTMPQVGALAAITEFIGATALGARVTSTIKSRIIDIDRFTGAPAVLMLAMCCAELGSASWLILATKLGFPVSTTQTCIGAIIGAGIASQAAVHWDWRRGSVVQIVVSWFVAPVFAGTVSAVLFASMKFCILERSDPFKRGLRAIPFYLAFTAAILALFLVMEVPSVGSLETLGVGGICGIILASFLGTLLIAYVFFMPYFQRRLVQEDTRVKFHHILLGPLLFREDISRLLYFPGDPDDELVTNYYEDSYAVLLPSIFVGLIAN